MILLFPHCKHFRTEAVKLLPRAGIFPQKADQVVSLRQAVPIEGHAHARQLGMDNSVQIFVDIRAELPRTGNPPDLAPILRNRFRTGAGRNIAGLHLL